MSGKRYPEELKIEVVKQVIDCGHSINRLQRQFSPDAPDERWVSDITYIRTHEGWLYLAVC